MAKRNKHSLSHYNLLSMDMGELVPVGLFEVLPGDTVQQASSVLLRVSPLLAPVMHPVQVRIHHWFVPHRLVWDNWENFITGGPDGNDNSVFPTMEFGAATGAVGTLSDYIGVPPLAGSPNVTVSALPFRGYGLIWNEWYRDEDLETTVTVNTTDGNDVTTNKNLQNAAWEKDYFTSSRPWTQKGPDVTLPLTGDAPIAGLAVDNTQAYTSAATGYTLADGTTPPSGSNWTGPQPNILIQGDNTTKVPTGLKADLSGVTAASVNELRLALALQRYQEARARYGSRYTEYLRYLGVRSSDARLQRPEYLGGGRQTIQFSEVLSTNEDASSKAGVLRGHGITAVRSNRYRRFIEEHGYVFTLMSVLPKTMYPQALHRTFNRRTKEDFWQKELEHIGQQAVEKQEIYAGSGDPKGVFGYQDRYDEYRRIPSRVSGEFRTSALDFWHMARIFASEPALNADFVKSNPTKRIHAVQTNDVLWCMVNHSIQARRLVSKMGRSFIF